MKSKRAPLHRRAIVYSSRRRGVALLSALEIASAIHDYAFAPWRLRMQDVRMVPRYLIDNG